MSVQETPLTLRRGRLRLKGKWFTKPQITLIIIGVVTTLVVSQATQRFEYTIASAIAFLLLVRPGRYGIAATGPKRWTKRLHITAKKNRLYNMGLNNAPTADGNKKRSGKRKKFNAAYHTVLQHGMPIIGDVASSSATAEPEMAVDYLGMFLNGARSHGMLLVGADGLGEGAVADFSERALYDEALIDGERDAVNLHGTALQIARIVMVRPGDVLPDLRFLDEHMEPSVRTATEATDPVGNTLREIMLEATGNSEHLTVTRVYAVNSSLPSGWKKRLGRSLYDPSTKNHAMPTTQEVFSTRLLSAAVQIENGLRRSGAQNPEILGVLQQSAFMGAAFTVHEADLASHYDRVMSDLIALETLAQAQTMGQNLSFGLEDLRTLQRGPFPFGVDAGDDWLKTGRTYHRILQVVHFRPEYLRPDLWESIVSGLQFPAILSVVTQSMPGRFQEFKLEEAARIMEIIRSLKDRGYDTESKKARAALEEAERVRDETFESGAALLEGNGFLIVSGESLEELRVYEHLGRQLFEGNRIDVEVVKGKENQLPFFLYALSIERL